MGWTHFFTRTFANVRTEMSLHVLAYNLKRVTGILGIAKAMKAMQLAGGLSPARTRRASSVNVQVLWIFEHPADVACAEQFSHSLQRKRPSHLAHWSTACATQATCARR